MVSPQTQTEKHESDTNPELQERTCGRLEKGMTHSHHAKHDRKYEPESNAPYRIIYASKKDALSDQASQHHTTYRKEIRSAPAWNDFARIQFPQCGTQEIFFVHAKPTCSHKDADDSK